MHGSPGRLFLNKALFSIKQGPSAASGKDAVDPEAPMPGGTVRIYALQRHPFLISMFLLRRWITENRGEAP